MSELDLTPILISIEFVERYKKLCEKYNDFDNRLRGKNRELSDRLLSASSYDFKYFKKENFYRISIKEKDHEIFIELVLKDGIVEPLLIVKKAGKSYIPKGRFDFIPQKMGIDFDRKKYNLPKYCSESDLENILKEVLAIFEDIKNEVLKQ